MAIDRTNLRVELARRNLKQVDLAGLLGVAPTTLSEWLLERHPAPENLRGMIEKALKLRKGTLK